MFTSCLLKYCFSDFSSMSTAAHVETSVTSLQGSEATPRASKCPEDNQMDAYKMVQRGQAIRRMLSEL